ncbi:MAG: hypothetical protein HYW70_00070 [Candidatus Nealsonbacteria bacterium]|nr:hypothetical protein [Candidatus Nealsonbacteria bacterium]
MARELTKEQYWELVQKLPDELKNQLFADETAKNIFDICDRNDVDIEKISEVADYAGRIIIGLLTPEEFQGILETRVGLEKAQAKKVAQEIHRFIFFPVKGALDELYKVGVEKKPAEEKLPVAEEKPAREGPDAYRETVE